MPTAFLLKSDSEYRAFSCCKDKLIGKEIVISLFAHHSTNFSLACGYHIRFVCYIGKHLWRTSTFQPFLTLTQWSQDAVAMSISFHKHFVLLQQRTPLKKKQKNYNRQLKHCPTCQLCYVVTLTLSPWMTLLSAWCFTNTSCSYDKNGGQTQLIIQLDCHLCHKMNKNQIQKKLP